MLNVECSYCNNNTCLKYTYVGDMCKRCNNGIIQLINIPRDNLLLYLLYSDKELENIPDDDDDSKCELKIYILNKHNKPSISYNDNETIQEITQDMWECICEKYNKNYKYMILKFCCEDSEFYYEFMSECYEYT
jgi:hypothetical protein